MKLKKALAKRIRALREASGLSQQEVAERGGLSLSLVAKLEQGKKGDPRASSLLALADALGVKPGQLLDDLYPAEGRKDEEPPPLNAEPPAKEKKRAKKKGGPAKEKKAKTAEAAQAV
jgi:transcriptional regulator with XRE-family HTH domain